MALAARAERPRVLRLHADLKIALPGREEDQRREAGLRPHRLWRDGLHWLSLRRIFGDVLSWRRCSVPGRARGYTPTLTGLGERAHLMTGRVFRYVRHADVAKFAEKGWELLPALDCTHHGEYSVLMRRFEKG
jgi:hypothetical protein